MRRRAGMTLIEVLIAVSLVSLLSVSILMAIRVGLNAMEKTNSRLMANRRSVGAQRVLEQQIQGFVPALADCGAMAGGRPSPIPFFQGEAQSMRFVSTYSLEEAHRGSPRILEFQVIPGKDNQGVRLIVNEFLFTGPRSAGMTCTGLVPDPELKIPVPRFIPIEANPRSFVLADRLAACRFVFKETLPQAPFERWVPRWVKPVWPTAIRVEMVPIEDDKARVPLLSVTLPVRVMKDPTFAYADE